jgi:uncharacterized DUF497 family protein
MRSMRPRRAPPIFVYGAPIFVYGYSVQIVWDEIKRQTNLAKHGMDFADLDLGFFESAIILPSVEGRSLAIGFLKGAVIAAVVYRPLGAEAVAVISMRRASRKERKLL